MAGARQYLAKVAIDRTQKILSRAPPNTVPAGRVENAIRIRNVDRTSTRKRV